MEELLKKAREIIKEPDAIADAYDLSFQWISPRLSKIIGYEPDEIINKQTISLHADSQEDARKTELDIFSTTERIVKELPAKTKSGKVLKITLEIFPMNFQGNPYMVGRVLKVE